MAAGVAVGSPRSRDREEKCYQDHRSCRICSTPAQGALCARNLFQGVSLSDVSRSGSECGRTESIVSGIQPLEANRAITSIHGESTDEDEELHHIQAGQFDDPESNHSASDDDNSDDDDSDDDNYDDVTWQPSMTDIHIEDDSVLQDDQPEVCPVDLVVDIDFNKPDGTESDVEEPFDCPKVNRGGFIRQDDPREAAKADKCISYTSCLLQLADLSVPATCQVKGCMAAISVSSEKKGTAVILTWKCNSGHVAKVWGSQPKLPRGILAGDFSLASCILLSGNNYRKVALMLKFMELGCVNPSSFWRIQSLYCCPAINCFWERKLAEIVEPRKDKEVIVAGDGRMDSPGFCAKYCTYTTVCAETHDILDMQIIDKRQTDLKSTNMETKGFKDALKNLTDKGMKVTEVVTDAHPSISAYMRKEHPAIKHSYDVWHGAKNLSKNITAISSYKATKDLIPWRSDIIGHFWHYCQKAEGSETVLRNKWTGILHHIIDEHEWALGQCEHEEVVDQTKDYLEAGSQSHQALAEFVFDDRLQRNLKYYVNYRSTAELEGFQNHILMYAGKRFAYTYLVYKARCQLAALDYQVHKDRPLLMDKDGNQRWHRTFNKNSVRWRAYAMKESKPYSYMEDILTDIFRRRIEDDGGITRRVELLESDPRHLSATIAPVPPPSTEELVSDHKSRFPVKCGSSVTEC